MSDPEQSRKQALECLRLEADCKQLAGRVHSRSLQSHLLRMAAVWSTLPGSLPSLNGSEGLSDVEAPTT